MSLIRFFVRRRLRARGYSDYAITGMIENIQRELLQRNENSFLEKIWAVRHGFHPDKLTWYGLTKENHHDYLSDFEYTWLFPNNGHFNFWLSNKVTYKYLLEPFSQFLPDYYFQIERGEILCLMDCPRSIPATADGIISLLHDKGALAAKPIIGLGGEGFFKFSFFDGEYFLNDNPSAEVEIIGLISNWRSANSGYVITEYLKPHHEFARIWSRTPNSMRITVARMPEEKAKIIWAFTRFGAQSTGVVDNTHAGGILNLVDIESGFFTDGAKIVNKKLIDCKYHPDTGALVEGTVPHWNLIKDKLVEIAEYLPQLTFMGFDIAIVEKGFKIHEINSAPAIYAIQAYKPLYKDENARKYFKFMVQDKMKRLRKS